MLCGTSAFKSALQQLVFGRDTIIYINIHRATDKKNIGIFLLDKLLSLWKRFFSFFVMKQLKF